MAFHEVSLPARLAFAKPWPAKFVPDDGAEETDR